MGDGWTRLETAAKESKQPHCECKIKGLSLRLSKPCVGSGDLFSGQGVGDVVGVQRQKPERAGRCWRRRVLGEGRPNFTTSSTGDPSQQGGAPEPTQPGSHAHSATLLCRGYRSKTQRKPPFLYFWGFLCLHIVSSMEKFATENPITPSSGHPFLPLKESCLMHTASIIDADPCSYRNRVLSELELISLYFLTSLAKISTPLPSRDHVINAYIWSLPTLELELIESHLPLFAVFFNGEIRQHESDHPLILRKGTCLIHRVWHQAPVVYMHALLVSAQAIVTRPAASSFHPYSRSTEAYLNPPPLLEPMPQLVVDQNSNPRQTLEGIRLAAFHAHLSRPMTGCV